MECLFVIFIENFSFPIFTWAAQLHLKWHNLTYSKSNSSSLVIQIECCMWTESRSGTILKEQICHLIRKNLASESNFWLSSVVTILTGMSVKIFTNESAHKVTVRVTRYVSVLTSQFMKVQFFTKTCSEQAENEILIEKMANIPPCHSTMHNGFSFDVFKCEQNTRVCIKNDSLSFYMQKGLTSLSKLVVCDWHVISE